MQRNITLIDNQDEVDFAKFMATILKIKNICRLKNKNILFEST